MPVRHDGSQLRRHAYRLRPPPPVCVRAVLATSQTVPAATPSGCGAAAAASAATAAALATADPTAIAAAAAAAIQAAL